MTSSDDPKTYTDSRGAAVWWMAASEPPEIVHGPAGDNLPDGHDIVREATLAGDRAWQREAMDNLHDIIVNCKDEFDGYAMPDAAGDWPDAVTAARRDDDPDRPSHAIRIALAMAENAAIDPAACARDVLLEDECDRQQQAFDVTRDLLGTHAAALDAGFTATRTP
jgi:hypothetical protein